MKRRLCKVIVLIGIFFFTISNAYGSGFAIYTQSASSLGQSAATIAHTEDASAIFFNPALINKLDGTQIQIGTTLMFPSRKFISESGRTYKEESNLYYPSTFYLTHKFNKKVSVGLGIFSPFGLGTKWPNDWEGRYITTKADMKSYNINPVISLQITPNIAVAGGLNFLFLNTTLEKKLNFSPLPDGTQKLKGDGTGFGCNFGVAIDLSKDISIGASYRSKIKVDIDGTITHHLPSPLLAPLFPDTDGKVDLTLPAQFHFGIYYKGLEPLTFEIAMRWEEWSSYKELKIDLNRPVAGYTTFITPKNWKDTYSINIGAKYQLNESLSLLAGYLYSGNPVPDSTFEPSLPDANTHLFTAGMSIKQKKFNFDLAYAYQKLQKRKKNNTIDDNPQDGIFKSAYSANGTYKSDIHMLGLSFTYKF